MLLVPRGHPLCKAGRVRFADCLRIRPVASGAGIGIALRSDLRIQRVQHAGLAA